MLHIVMYSSWLIPRVPHVSVNVFLQKNIDSHRDVDAHPIMTYTIGLTQSNLIIRKALH